MTTEELDRLAELEAKCRGPGEHKDASEFDFSNAIFDAAPALIALARWAERARQWIDDSVAHEGDRASECGKCQLLAAYPKGE